jgi:hypothetical protein
MKRLFQIGLMLLPGLFAARGSQYLVRDYNWKQLAQRHELHGGEIVPMHGMWVLKIENSKDTPLYCQILTITNPPISKMVCAVIGRVRYENVQKANGGSGGIQMLLHFADKMLVGAPYEPGGMKCSGGSLDFSGTSDWTDLILSFDRTEWMNLWSNAPPKLEISVFLAARGTVYLQPLQLVEYERSDIAPVFSAVPTSRTWWSARASGLIGGIGGSVIGCFGGLVGCLVGFGKARKFVLTMTKVFIALGIILTVAGIIAVGFQQPYAIWYALLLPGIILTLVFGANFYPIKKRFDELEIRRMTSIDAQGS